MKYRVLNIDILHNKTRFEQGKIYDLDDKTAKVLAKNLQKVAEDESAAETSSAPETNTNKKGGGKR